jgi:hypothetical protein
MPISLLRRALLFLDTGTNPTGVGHVTPNHLRGIRADTRGCELVRAADVALVDKILQRVSDWG